jgi:hypothetical protein
MKRPLKSSPPNRLAQMLLRLTPEQAKLRREHGTPDQFEAACRDSLGEISLGELEAAVQKYRLEWDAAGRQNRWLKISLTVKRGDLLYDIAWAWCRAFEHWFCVKNLYFARYQDLLQAHFEVSAETKAMRDELELFTREGLWTPFYTGSEDMRGLITDLAMEDRSAGSVAHAFAYQMAASLPIEPEGQEDWPQLQDVVHWALNMRGLDYLRELEFHGRACAHLAALLAANNEKIINSKPMATVARKAQRSLKSVDKAPWLKKRDQRRQQR